MSISIIGAGNVGMALGQVFSQRGETVVFGVPEPAKYADAIAALGGKARVTTTAEAVAASEAVILAVPYAALPVIAQSVPDWQGKVLIDTTNPLAPGLAGLSVGTTTSGAEELAKLARGARVVKAFNTTGAENMADPHYGEQAATMFLCGDDELAKAAVWQLAEELGFEPADAGPLSAARHLENLALLWIHLAQVNGMGRGVAFRLMRR